MLKEIEGYKGIYLVSDDGKVYSNAKGKHMYELSQTLLNNGYLSVHLNAVKVATCLVHRIVATAFCERESGCNYVDHINGIKEDNRAINLRWVTQKDNMKNTNTKRKLIVGVIQKSLNGDIIKKWDSMNVASKSLKIHKSTICQCCRGLRHNAGGFLWEYSGKCFNTKKEQNKQPQINKDEIWKKAPFERGDIEVSSMGRVRRINPDGSYFYYTNKKSDCGYVRINITIDGKDQRLRVHKLVMETFVGPPKEGEDVDHINTNTSDNRLANLRYVSRLENMRNHKTIMKMAKKIYQYDANGNFMNEYSCARYASQANNRNNIRAIRASARSNGWHKYDGFYWSYSKCDMKEILKKNEAIRKELCKKRKKIQ